MLGCSREGLGWTLSNIRTALPLGETRARLYIAIILVMPSIARANPVSVDGQSLIAFAIVAFWGLVIESGIVFLNTAAW